MGKTVCLFAEYAHELLLFLNLLLVKDSAELVQ